MISGEIIWTAACLFLIRRTQDTHSGGSGCGCAAVTLASYIYPKLRDGRMGAGSVCSHRGASVDP